MLHEVGKVLRSSFRESDVLGRVGGDEFLLLLKNIDLEVALDKLEQVKRQLAAVKVGSQGKALSVSMGVYVPEDDDLAYRDVFVKADEDPAHRQPSPPGASDDCAGFGSRNAVDVTARLSWDR